MQPIHASAVERAFVCAGSVMASQQVTADQATAESVMADAAGAAQGTADHAEVAEHIQAKALLDEDTPYHVRTCIETLVEFDEPVKEYVEVPIASGVYCGTPDYVAVAEDVAHVYDWKLGWGGDREGAPSSLQTGTYAWLVRKQHGIDNVTVHIVAPRHPLPEQRHTFASYKHAWPHVDRLMDEIRVKVTRKDAPRTPSIMACRYCPAKGTPACPESSALLMRAGALVAKPQTLPDIPNEKLLKLMDAAELASLTAVKILAEGKRRMILGQLESEYWTLTKPVTRRKVRDAYVAWGSLKGALKGTPKEKAQAFLSSCKITNDALFRLFKAAEGLKGKAAEEAFYEKFGELIESREGAPMMKRVR